jgi:hypothetical protein
MRASAPPPVEVSTRTSAQTFVNHERVRGEAVAVNPLLPQRRADHRYEQDRGKRQHVPAGADDRRDDQRHEQGFQIENRFEHP